MRDTEEWEQSGAGGGESERRGPVNRGGKAFNRYLLIYTPCPWQDVSKVSANK